MYSFRVHFTWLCQYSAFIFAASNNLATNSGKSWARLYIGNLFNGGIRRKVVDFLSVNKNNIFAHKSTFFHAFLEDPVQKRKCLWLLTFYAPVQPNNRCLRASLFKVHNTQHYEGTQRNLLASNRDRLFVWEKKFLKISGPLCK